MENQKRVPLISVLIILLCISVCIGATYAYFASSVASNGNKVKAGKLDVDLQLLTDSSTNTWLTITESADPVFNYELWEPGYTAVKVLRVVNNGNLAVKWEARFISNTAVSELADVIQVDVKTGNGNGEISYPANVTELLNNTWGESKENLKSCINSAAPIASGTLLSTDPKASTYIVIALHMPIEADNTYQDQLLGEFDIEIVATQFIYESDAFGSDYDEGAKFPCEHPATEVIEGYEPTYEQTGLTDGKKCIICTEVVEQQEEIPMLVEKEYPDLVFTRHEGANGSYYSVRGADSITSTDIEIPSTYYGYPVTEIEDEAFLGSNIIKSVKMPNSITDIGDYAFYFCESLTSVTMPEDITELGKGVFWGCTSLPSITIPNSVTSIDCSFGNCDSLTHIEIPDSVTSIDDRAFLSCDNLESVTIGEGVSNIGYQVFAECPKLESVTIGSNVTSSGEAAFGWCTSLTGVTMPDTLTDIGKQAFAGCTSLKDVIIPSNVTTIENSAFAGCTGLTDVTIPNSVITLGNGAFYKCEGLTSVTIGNGVTSIGDSTFEGCYRLTSITIGDSVTSIGEYAFYRCAALTSIIIPDSVITLDDRVFVNCFKLTDVTIGSGVTSIGVSVFTTCSKLTSVVFKQPNGWSASGLELSAEDLSIPSTAATYLVKTYGGKYWNRTE